MKKIYIFFGILLMSKTVYAEPYITEDDTGKFVYSSEPFSEIKIEDGINFAYTYYQDAYLKSLEHDGLIDILTEKEYRLGNPILIYNVDGETQDATIYIPRYKLGENVVSDIFDVEYARGRWTFWSNRAPISMDFETISDELITKIDQSEDKYIFYSINYTVYAESKKEKVILLDFRTRNWYEYSELEQEFMRMTFLEKCVVIEQNLECNMQDMSKRRTDEDELGVIIGYPPSTVKVENTGETKDGKEKLQFAAKILGVLLLIGIFIFMAVNVKRRGSRKFEPTSQDSSVE